MTKNERTFDILKFRSMIVDAEKDGHSIPATDQDPRITKAGRVIGATRLDELSQLLNILKGNMSIVCPRTERVELVEKYSLLLDIKQTLITVQTMFKKESTEGFEKALIPVLETAAALEEMEINNFEPGRGAYNGDKSNSYNGLPK